MGVSAAENYIDWPLHTKKVTPVNLPAIFELVNGTEPAEVALRNRLSIALQWFDLRAYSVCRTRPARRADFALADIIQMQHNGKIELADASPTLNTINGFAIPEIKKLRRRPIFETLTNRDLGKETLQIVKHLPRTTIRRQTLPGSCAFSFDFASYYDAFVLPAEIRPLFRFFAHGQLYQLRTLAMGQRQACEIAQCTTDILAALPSSCPAVGLATMIDNVRFSGLSSSRCQLLFAVRRFLRRCVAANLTLNDVDPVAWLALGDDELWSRRVLEEDFLGEHYDYSNGTVCNTTSTLAKLQAVIAILEEEIPLPKRRIAAIYGLLLFARHTVSAPLAPYFVALRYLRELDGRSGWDEMAPLMCSSVRLQLLALARLLVINTAVTISLPPSRSEVDLIIVIDASMIGWGCVVANAASGSVFAFSEPWPDTIARSAVAEPRAIKRAIGHFLRPSDRRNVLVVTDHSAIVWAAPGDDGSGGYAKGYELNSLFYLLSLYKSTFFFSFVAGTDNIADVLSREGVLTPGRKNFYSDMSLIKNFVRDKTTVCGMLGRTR